MSQIESNNKNWNELNNRLLAAMQQNDWLKMKTIYFEQALMLKSEGRDPFKFIEESVKSEVCHDQDHHIEQIEIITAMDSCSECKSFNGNLLTINEATEQHPVPVADCSKKPCRCSYIPVVPDLFPSEDEECQLPQS